MVWMKASWHWEKPRYRCQGCGRLWTRWAAAGPQQRARERSQSRTWAAGRREEMRSIIRAAKARPCADCGGEWPHYVMHFHHRDPATKDAVIGHMIRAPGAARAIERLREEIEKCDVLCANCHALRHGGKFGPVREHRAEA